MVKFEDLSVSVVESPWHISLGLLEWLKAAAVAQMQ
jgi:hypothetical protein